MAAPEAAVKVVADRAAAARAAARAAALKAVSKLMPPRNMADLWAPLSELAVEPLFHAFHTHPCMMVGPC